MAGLAMDHSRDELLSNEELMDVAGAFSQVKYLESIARTEGVHMLSKEDHSFLIEGLILMAILGLNKE